MEYVHDRKTGTVSNQVWCSLIHDGLGFRDTIFFQHDKDIPAIHEKEDLERVAGKTLKPITPGKTCTIVHHGDFYFGILICSELTDINYRARLRGSVDAILKLRPMMFMRISFSAITENSAIPEFAFPLKSILSAIL